MDSRHEVHNLQRFDAKVPSTGTWTVGELCEVIPSTNTDGTDLKWTVKRPTANAKSSTSLLAVIVPSLTGSSNTGGTDEAFSEATNKIVIKLEKIMLGTSFRGRLEANQASATVSGTSLLKLNANGTLSITSTASEAIGYAMENKEIDTTNEQLINVFTIR